MIYAVFDTNVIVSALLSRNPDAATVKVFEALMLNRIIPLINDEIVNEYEEVLHRPKFRFPDNLVSAVIANIEQKGIRLQRTHSKEYFPDSKDAVFYEIALSKEASYLITGNIKHFPKSPIVVTPAEMLEILLNIS